MDRVVRVFDLDATEAPPVAHPREREHILDEATLESWLHATPDLLVDEPLLIFGRQPSVEAGIPDLVALDQYANVFVFELKAGLSGTGSASEETIQSQPLNYASSLSTYDYEDLNEMYQSYRSDVVDGRWDVEPASCEAATLGDAFEARFGSGIDHGEYNRQQRVAIVAETITEQTAENARFRLDAGANIQCVEVQLFSGPEQDESILTSSAVVDYDDSRIRPDRRENPSHPDVVGRIARDAFPEFQELVSADRLDSVMTGLGGRNPDLTSNDPNHPEAVNYSIRVKPDFGHARVVLSLDFADDDVLEALRANEEAFDEAGFDVSHTRSQQRIVVGEWAIDHLEEVDESDVARQFVRLVELGHETLSEDSLGQNS